MKTPHPSGIVLLLLDDAAATGRAMAALARQADRARILAAVDDLNRTWPGFESSLRSRAAHALRRQQRAAKARLIRRRPQPAAAGRAMPFHGGRP
jgi:hypothetical protein